MRPRAMLAWLLPVPLFAPRCFALLGLIQVLVSVLPPVPVANTAATIGGKSGYDGGGER